MTDVKNNRAAALTEVSLVLAATFWGLNFAATKYAAGSIPPLLLVALRFVVGGLLLLLVLRILEPGSKLGRKDLLPMAALGCFGVARAQTGFTFGVSTTSAASTGLIFATAPVWGLLLGSVLGLERPTFRGILGLALSVAGVGIVVFEGASGPKARASSTTRRFVEDRIERIGEDVPRGPVWGSKCCYRVRERAS